MSEKLPFQDWKSQGKVGEFCYRKPVGTLNHLMVTHAGVELTTARS